MKPSAPEQAVQMFLYCLANNNKQIHLNYNYIFYIELFIFSLFIVPCLFIQLYFNWE